LGRECAKGDEGNATAEGEQCLPKEDATRSGMHGPVIHKCDRRIPYAGRSRFAEGGAVPSERRRDPVAGCGRLRDIYIYNRGLGSRRYPTPAGRPPGRRLGTAALHSLASQTKLRPAACALRSSRFYQQRAPWRICSEAPKSETPKILTDGIAFSLEYYYKLKNMGVWRKGRYREGSDCSSHRYSRPSPHCPDL
jgi:hypothetical protein